MAINLFGVTPAVVASRVHSLTISATSEPTSTAVEDMIDECAAELQDACAAMGIDAEGCLDSGGTESLYKQLRGALIWSVADAVLLSRARGSQPNDRAYRTQYLEKLEQLRTRPQEISAQSNVDVTVDLGDSQYATDVLVPGLVGKILRRGL